MRVGGFLSCEFELSFQFLSFDVFEFEWSLVLRELSFEFVQPRMGGARVGDLTCQSTGIKFNRTTVYACISEVELSEVF